MLGPVRSKVYERFPALKQRSYRLYFYGQLISFTGSWLHGVAHGWLTFELTQSAFWLGVVTAVSSLPVLFLSLYGGFLVDKYNRRKMLILTQGSSLILALILGFMVITNSISLIGLLVITFLSGLANAIDNPASQAFVVDIVPKEDLPSAVGLNSTMFNTGRVLGPAAAGFLIAIVGVGNIFFINALSFLAILVNLFRIKVNSQIINSVKNPAQAIKEGVKYSIAHPVINKLLLTAGIGALFCFSQATIMPVFVSEVFSKSSETLGYLLSATGVGALSGSLVVSSLYKKYKPSTFVITGNVLFIFSTFAFTFTKDLMLASIFLLISGFGLTIQFSTIYATIQRLVQEEFRGRVSSIYVLLFVGLSPLGNLFIGSSASLIGPQMTVRLFSFIIFLYSLTMAYYLGKISFNIQFVQNKIKPVFIYARNRIVS